MVPSVIKIKSIIHKTFLEDCKYEIKKNKMENHINDDLDPSSSDNESDNGSDNESDSRSDH